ncbi:hypothetical protein GGI07_005434 [Coemansia sp. Benny D115]|nr:hypothetical protein GGI07_005434 [Coemansia sp. Benny D115]
MIWNQLSFPENSVDLTGGILDQSGNKWVSHNILGSSPQSHQEPTLGLQALASLYTHLPRLTPKETLEIADSKDPMSKRKARRLRKAAAASQGQSVSKQANAEMKSDDEEDKGASSVISGSQVLVEYWYSLQRSGDTFSKALGHAKKQVPMYCAEELFGKELSDTVISWLLLHGQASVLAKEADAASDSTYVGIAALPSTCDLALQFHRITAFVQGV